MLLCLNLPSHLRFLPANIFIAGVMPGPHPPDPDQLHHLLDLLIIVLLSWWPGKQVRTHLHPEGRLHRVGVLVELADLPALCKLTGFYSSAANKPCSWCLFDKSQQTYGWPSGDFHHYEPRNAETVRKQAHAWKDLAKWGPIA